MRDPTNGAAQLARALDWWVQRRLAYRLLQPLAAQMGYSAFELREALRGIAGAGDLTISQRDDGAEVIHIGGRDITVADGANIDEIKAEVAKYAPPTARVLVNPFERTQIPMSITGGKYASTSLRTAMQALKTLSQQAVEETSAAIKDATETAQAHLQLAQGIKAETAELKAALAEFTNGEP